MTVDGTDHAVAAYLVGSVVQISYAISGVVMRELGQCRDRSTAADGLPYHACRCLVWLGLNRRQAHYCEYCLPYCPACLTKDPTGQMQPIAIVQPTAQVYAVSITS